MSVEPHVVSLRFVVQPIWLFLKGILFFNLGLETSVMNDMGGHRLEGGREDEGRANGQVHLLSTYYVLCI